ncbi:TetR/AcrR family transcriptional regulator [Fodinicola feengrottensis]|uniref:TetR/AcrR family transcriptional regulator n=1 Tax=Fodinicola feengrottensis TaxID=435914 RepID=UPI0031DE3BE6
MHSDNQTFIETARRAQLVDCAIQAIAEWGYARASMAKIAARAGVSTGVISYHFGSKEELIEQVVATVVTVGKEAIEPHVRAAGGARAGLRALIITNLDFIRTHPAYMRAMVEIIARGGPVDGSGPYAGHGDAAIEDVQKVLHWGQQTGEFRHLDTRVVAVALRAAIDAIATRLSAEPDLDLVRYGEQLADMFDFATRKGQ